MSTSLQDILAFIRDLLVFPIYEELIWSSCVSGSRAGRLPIRRSDDPQLLLSMCSSVLGQDCEHEAALDAFVVV